MIKSTEAKKEELVELRGLKAERLSNCSEEVINALYESPGAINYIHDRVTECTPDRIKALAILNRVPRETAFHISTLLTCPVKDMLIYSWACDNDKINSLYDDADDDDMVLNNGVLVLAPAYDACHPQTVFSRR